MLSRISLLLFIPALAALTVPQEPATPRANPGQTTTTTTTRAPVGEDGLLAAWLLVGNQNEIALAQIARQKATDPEVKRFAETMIADHGKMVQKLTAFAGSAAVGAGAADSTGGNGGTGTGDVARRPAEASAPRTPAGAGSTIALVQELGKQCLDSSRRELEAKQGAEFDGCFMGMALGAHMHANDALTVFRRHASPALETELAEAQKTVQAHLEHAKTLVKSLGGKQAK